MKGVVAWVVVGLGLALLAGVLLRREPTALPPMTRAQAVGLQQWAFQFSASLTNGSVTGSEYFSASESAVRRDWVVGAEPLPDGPFGAFSSGSEFVTWAEAVQWGGAARLHLLQYAGGTWNCTETALPPDTPVPRDGVNLTAGTVTGSRNISGVWATGYAHPANTPRPGPACPGPWTAWIASKSADDRLVQLDTGCWSLAISGWGFQPGPKKLGETVGPYSVPAICPVERDPSILGYVLSALFAGILFFAVVSVKRDPTGAAIKT